MRPRRPVTYFHAMVDRVEEYMLSGLESNSDIAMVLRGSFDERITDRHVTQWRAEHRRFDRACTMTVHTANMIITNVVYEAAKEGDIATARWWAERRIPAFMPKSKMTHDGRIENLDDTLRRRAMTDKDARAKGLIYDDTEEEDDA